MDNFVNVTVMEHVTCLEKYISESMMSRVHL